jgi:FSR family fosmidomycin resistance protein-like MFS transporter
VTAPAIRMGSDARVISLVGGAHFFSHFYLFVLPPLFPILKTELGLSYTALGGMVTAFSIASGSAQYPMGMAVDRFGARYILIGGLTLLSLSVAMMSLASGYLPFLILAFLAGLGNSVFHPADYTILGASVSEHRLGRAYSIHTFSGHVGWSVAPPVMVFLTAMFNWRMALAIVGCTGLAIAVLLFQQSGFLKHDHRPQASHDASAPTQSAFAMLTALPILMMFLFYLATAAITVGMASFTPSALGALFGTPLVSANAALTALLVGGAAGVLSGGWVADKLRRFDLIAAIGFLAGATAMCLVAFVALPVVGLVIVFGFSGFMVGIVSPSRDLMVRAVTPPGASGKVFGFVSVGLDVGGAGAPLLYGWILDQGAPAGVFLAAGTMMLLSLLAALAAARSRARAPQASPAE